MSITQLSLAAVLRQHVTLKVESIDRMYLNVYIPPLQRETGASWFLKQHRKCPVASSAAMAPISHAFVDAIEGYAQTHQVPALTFEKGPQKDDVVAPYVARAAGHEGIVLIGKAQEKCTTFRTHKGHGPHSHDAVPVCFRRLFGTYALSDGPLARRPSPAKAGRVDESRVAYRDRIITRSDGAASFR